jgi:flagellar biosynthesis protein FliP
MRKVCQLLTGVLAFAAFGVLAPGTAAQPNAAAPHPGSPAGLSPEAAQVTPVAPKADPLRLTIGLDGAQRPGDVSVAVQIVILMTLLTLAPSIVLLMTSFTRIVIVLGFVRTALGVPSAPSNQIIIGLSLFLTFFLMGPVFDRMNAEAIQPYLAGTMTSVVALDKASVPLKEFMLKQTREKDIALFLNIAKLAVPATPIELPMRIVVPAFAISELKTAFEIGFLIYLPFLIIDVVVSSVLLSMGMMMLPPTLVSLPFKLLLFVLVDGWNLVVGTLVRSFQ